MEKINVAELLKDCPKGMELDCALYDDVTLSEVSDNRDYKFPIKIAIGANRYRHLTKTGGYDIIPESKCVIYPKGKTTWEGFVPPCQFKVGDKVVFDDAKEKPLTIRKIWWDWQAKENLCSFEEDDIDVPVNDLDRYIKPKFDITTLKPFDRVLVKDNVTKRWIPSLFGYLRSDDDYPYVVIGGVYWRCCIPYEGNEHLLGKCDDCDEYYKTWE